MKNCVKLLKKKHKKKCQILVLKRKKKRKFQIQNERITRLNNSFENRIGNDVFNMNVQRLSMLEQ